MTQKLVLDNGTTVLIDRMQDVRSFALGFFVAAGSGDEPPAKQGVSHFLEHVLFKRTGRPVTLLPLPLPAREPHRLDRWPREDPGMCLGNRTALPQTDLALPPGCRAREAGRAAPRPPGPAFEVAPGPGPGASLPGG